MMQRMLQMGDVGDQQLAVLFTARPQLPFAKNMPKNNCRELTPFIDGFRDYLELFEEGDPPPRDISNSKTELRKKEWKEKIKKNREANKDQVQGWNPFEGEEEEKTTDPLKTLFVGRLVHIPLTLHLEL